MNDATDSAADSVAGEAVAIIGIACRFPGADDPAAFWANLCAGVESVRRFAPDELEDSFAPAVRNDPGFVAARPILKDVDRFDAGFFGMQPREAALTDPQHRLFLECCWQAFEDAGRDPAGSNTGVFAGCSMPTYLIHNLLADRAAAAAFASGYQVDNYQHLLGSLGDVLATRVSYKLDLRGPSMTVQTACSTSLVAVAQACQALLLAQCDMALAGGVSVTFPQRRGYRHTEGGMVSADGHCRPFDAAASGTIFGDGCGVVLLKRLSDALADGDRIHAVIRGFATNNDGAGKAGFTAPSVAAQAQAVAQAQALAGVTADAIGYVECHGTATPLGDPIEVAGLTAAFRETTDALGFCAIGSVKGNIGHLDAAAGIAGLIKATLAVREGSIPPTLHYTAPNPHLRLDGSPFFVAARTMSWPPLPGPRRAGVSALGVGGTNAHVVIEEPPPAAVAAGTDAPAVLAVSARSDAALADAREQLAAWLAAHPDAALADVAHTLARRRGFARRSAVVARDAGEAVRKLHEARAVAAGAPGVVFMFPGQGAQHPGMAAALHAREPVFRAALDRCADILAPLTGADLRDVLYGGEPGAAAALRETSLAQPAIFSVSYALAQLWMAWGVTPSAMIGHSVGEFVAATLAGVLRLEDALALIAARGRLMQGLPGGAMLAVTLPEAEVAPLLGADLDLAAVNGASLCVVAGPHHAVAALEAALAARGAGARRLHTSHAFHSTMMDPIVPALERAARGAALGRPEIPWVSCVTGGWITEAEAGSAEYWARHCRAPVRFAQGLATLLDGMDAPPVLLEVGPGATLAMLARGGARGRAAAILSSLPGASPEAAEMDATETIAAARAGLWSAGAAIELAAAEPGGVLSLPTYPFERTRHWIDAPAAETATVATAEPAAEAAPCESASASAPAARPDAVRAGILEALAALSGNDYADAPEDATFLELGFDSLLLSQVAQAVQARFGVAVGFRHLLGDLGTVAALAAHLSARLPQVAAAVEPAPPAVAQPAAEPAAETEMPNRFRRYSAPQAASAPTELTEEQRRFVAALAARLTARTARSKAMTQAHRAVLADPRTASGFRAEWKELVYPIVVERASGSRVWDIDGNAYIDLVNGFGPTAFGHGPEFVMEAVRAQLERGFPIGPQSDLAGPVAALVSELTGNERVTFCCTGSEAVMGALRLARAVTGRKRVVAFAGAYHGGFDEVLARGVRAGGEPRALPAAAGVLPEAVANLTLLEYGAEETLDWIRAHAQELAAVLVEPVQSRHPALQPRAFLHELRAITEQSGAALIFDEVVTGFRLHPGGAQALFGVRADLATYGKVVGGGMPIGILAGCARFMDALDGGFWQYGDDSAPEAAVTVFAGTFVRHPLALAAALAVLEHLKAEGPALQQALGARTAALAARLNRFAESRGIASRVEHCGSIFHFNPAAEDRRASLLFHLLREQGIHAQEGFPLFLTTAHTDADIDAAARGFEQAIDTLQAVGILAPQPGTAAVARETVVPLTEPQMEIYLAAQLGDGPSCVFNEGVSIELSGALNGAALRGALDDLAARHEALRARLSPSGDAMAIAPSGTIPVTELDLSDSPDAAARLSSLLDREARTPFDLTAGPLARAHLVRRGTDDHLLVLTAHHIVVDGWSTNVLITDLAALYEARCNGLAPALPPAPSFAAHARAERGRADDTDWWAERFAAPPPPLDLPADRARAVPRTFAGATLHETIDAALYQSVRRAAARHGCTPFAAMLAAFHALMGRLSGTAEVAVGVPTAGQALLDDPALVAHCVNFLPIAARWNAATTLAQHAAAVQGQLADAREHPRCTLGTLVRRLALPRDPQRMPLTDVQFNLERMAAPARFGGLRAAARGNPKAFVNFDLFFNLTETAEGIRLDCDYSTELFDAATVRRWIGHYRTLLAAFAADSGVPVARAALLTPAECAALALTAPPPAPASALPLPLPRERRFDEWFAAQARSRSDAVAAECGTRRWTYAELDARAEAIARHLAARIDGPEARIGVLMDRSLDMLAALLAVARAGFAYVPLDPAHPAARLAAIIEGARPAALLVDAAAPALEGSAVPRIDLSRPLPVGGAPQAPPQQPGAGRLAYVIHTSGSTGAPKGVAISHAALSNLLAAMAARFPLGPQDALLAVTTIAFDIAALELFLPLACGARVVIAARDELADGFALLARLEAQGITAMQATPSTWRLLLEAGFRSRPDLTMLCGGEALPRALADRLLEGGGVLWNLYGPTETTVWSSAGIVRPGDAPVTIGQPIDNTRFYLLDDAGEPVPPGVRGELCIAGRGLADGYAGDPARTAERFPADPFVAGERMYRTGDLARLTAEGEIEVLGRIDKQIKLRGFRIEPGEIEAAMISAGGVAAAVVTLRQDAGRSARLVGYYVEHPGRPRDAAALHAAVAGRVPAYMIPSAFVRLDAIPLTPNGKVNERALPAPADADAAGPQPARRAPLVTPVQQTLGRIWQEVLGLEAVGADDDLFALGADSIQIFQIVARATRAGLATSAKDLMRLRSIAALAEAIGGGAPAGRDSVPATAGSARAGSPPKLSAFRRNAAERA